MKITDIPLEALYYFNAERTMGREVREGRFEGATEYWCGVHGKWAWAQTPRCNDVDCGKFWSRPIDVGEGWELVGLDEVLSFGDELLCVDGKSWVGTAQRDCTKTIAELHDLFRSTYSCVRRRKKPEHQPAQSGEWVSVKERLPEEGSAVWFLWNDRSVVLDIAFCKFKQERWLNSLGSHITDWMPANIPKPPAPAKTDAEAAWEKHSKLPWFSMTCKEHYLAGYAAGKEAR